MSSFSRTLSAVIPLLCAAPAYAHEEAKDPYEDNLLGHWGGLRDSMSAAGIEPTLEYKADLWRNTSGGIKRGGSYLDNLDIKFEIDGEKLFGLKGNKAMLWVINNAGGKPNARLIGSAQGMDNIEVGKNAAKLYEAWDEQSFLDGRLSVLAGVHDMNTEFVVTDVTANFISPQFQIGTSFAQSGVNGPSVFPNTSLSARVRYNPSDEAYLMGGIFDAIANDPNNPYANRYHFDGGALLVGEAGFTPKPPEGIESVPNKFALGAWMYTKETADLVDVDAGGNPVKQRSYGLYALSSYLVYFDKESGHALSAFFRPAISDGDTKQVSWSYEAGLSGNGWVPTRPDGEIGLGFSQAHNAHKYIRSVVAGGSTADNNEYAVELYYRDKLYKGVTVQPDLQYIANPGTTPTVKNATILGLRVDINF